MADDPARRPPHPAPCGGARPGEAPALEGKLAELAAACEPAGDDAQLRRSLADLEAEHRQLLAEHVELQERHAELVALWVASGRLCEARERAKALAAVEEMVVNLVGSERYAVFERGDDGRLAPVSGMGVDWRLLPPITPGEGPLGRAAAEDRIVVQVPASPDEPLALVPFRAGGRAGGALAIYGLLPQKPALTELDRELFTVLQRHAGLALGTPPAER